MKMSWKKIAVIGGVAYVALWIVTAVFGSWQIDARFKNEFATGTKAAISGQLERYPMEETKRIPQFDVTQGDGGLGNNYPELPWKYKSKALAIAPFVLVDRCAHQTGGLCGWGGIRMHIWFFGLTRWWLVKSYWCS